MLNSVFHIIELLQLISPVCFLINTAFLNLLSGSVVLSYDEHRDKKSNKKANL